MKREHAEQLQDSLLRLLVECTSEDKNGAKIKIPTKIGTIKVTIRYELEDTE